MRAVVAHRQVHARPAWPAQWRRQRRQCRNSLLQGCQRVWPIAAPVAMSNTESTMRYIAMLGLAARCANLHVYRLEPVAGWEPLAAREIMRRRRRYGAKWYGIVNEAGTSRNRSTCCARLMCSQACELTTRVALRKACPEVTRCARECPVAPQSVGSSSLRTRRR